MSTSNIKFKNISGFFSRQAGVSDYDILKTTALSLANEEREILNGVIHVHSVADLRIGVQMIRHLRVIRMMCGGKALRNSVIVTTGWDTANDRQAQFHEKDLLTNPFLFKPFLDAGCHYFRYNNTPDSARKIFSHLLDKQPVMLQIQEELAEGMKLEDTAAGAELMAPAKIDEMCDAIWEAIYQERGMLEDERGRWEARSRQLQDALKEQEESWRRELELERAERKAEREKSDDERRQLQDALKEQVSSLRSQVKDSVLQELEQGLPCGAFSAQSDLYELLRSGIVRK